MTTDAHILLWAGAKHSGKSTSARDLVERALTARHAVAGILAPSCRRRDALVGFDVVDITTNRAAPLLRRAANGQPADVGEFAFVEAGLAAGRDALAPAATDAAELVVIDEFGPLEMREGGWRQQADRLAADGRCLVLLVVREELVDRVAMLYSRCGTEALAACEPASADRVLALLAERSAAGGPREAADP